MKIVKIINFKKKKKWEIYHKIQRFYLKKNSLHKKMPYQGVVPSAETCYPTVHSQVRVRLFRSLDVNCYCNSVCNLVYF